MYPGCYPGLYSLWGFAPPLTVTMAAAHSAGLFSCSGFAPSLLVTSAAMQYTIFFLFMGLLSVTTEFHAFSRHIRVSSCYSVATIKIFVRCIVTGCEVATRIFFNNERSERSEIPVLRFLLPTSLRGSWRTTDNRRGKMLTKIKR